MKRIDDTYEGDDESCEIYCSCGHDKPLYVNSGYVYRCPNCKRGYRSTLSIYEYEPDELDPEYEEQEVAHRRSEEWYALNDKIRMAKYLFEAMPNNKKFEEELAALREEEEKWLKDNYGHIGGENE